MGTRNASRTAAANDCIRFININNAGPAFPIKSISRRFRTRPAALCAAARQWQEVSKTKSVSTMPRSRVWILFFLLGALTAGLAGPANAANLTVHVEGVLQAGGILRLGLYDQANYPDDNARPVASADIPAVPGETIVTLHNVPPGTYAVQAYEDVNANGKMDTSWVGLPLEPFGFSLDAKPFLSKPPFDEVKFAVLPGENSQILHLQNTAKSSPTDKARDTIRARQRR